MFFHVSLRSIHQCRDKGVDSPVADGEPGVERQIDFAPMGSLPDPETGKKTTR
jgi:hypothetical protein